MLGTLECAAILRVTSNDGPLTDATAIFEGIPEPVRADRYGRIIIGLRKGQTARARVHSKGYSMATVSVACPSGVNVEEDVRLRKE